MFSSLRLSSNFFFSASGFSMNSDFVSDEDDDGNKKSTMMYSTTRLLNMNERSNGKIQKGGKMRGNLHFTVAV